MTKHQKKKTTAHTIGLSILCSIFFMGCSTVPEVGTNTNKITKIGDSTDEINWPERYLPEEATFYVHNEIYIDATPQTIWDILIQAETWPAWYEGATNVKIQNSDDGLLKHDSIFTWNTMGLSFESKIKEYAPPYRLSWESRKSSIQGYHAWLIKPLPQGSKLVTDESQHGLLASLQNIFLPNKLRLLHDVWLEEIKKKAEAKLD